MAPISVAFCTVSSNSFGRRIIGTPARGQAAIIFSISPHVIVLCCISKKM